MSGVADIAVQSDERINFRLKHNVRCVVSEFPNRNGYCTGIINRPLTVIQFFKNFELKFTVDYSIGVAAEV